MNFQRTNTKISLLEDYYEHFNEEGRLKTRHGQVEFITSLKYILDILQNDKNKKILDIGAGTGAYSIYLDNLGFDVTSVELVQHNIDIFKAKNSNCKIYQGDARNLSMIESNSYDITLLFGPMYHLLKEEDRLKALNEAKRVTKNNGVILISYYMNEYAVLTYGFSKQHIKEAISLKQIDEDFHVQSIEGDLYSMVRIEDIDKYNKMLSLKRSKIVASDGASNYMRVALNRLTEEEFQIYLKYHLSICERKELLGASAHLLDIVIK